MKRFTLITAFLCVWLGYACQTEDFIPTYTPSLASNVYSRGLFTGTALPKGSTALFNATGELQWTNEVFTYDGTKWSNGTEWELPSSPTTLTAIYPVLANHSYTTDNLYQNGELEDILMAQETITAASEVTLNFHHLFSLLTIQVHADIQKNLATLCLTVPQKVKSVTPSTGEYTLMDIEHSVTKDKQENGTYTFLIPPMTERSLIISIQTENGNQYSQTTEAYTFLSGYKYECNVVNAETPPGIYTAEDLVDFSLLINGYAPHYHTDKDLTDFGQTIDGKMTYQLLNDITLTESHCDLLLPIGLDDKQPFQAVFDGGGYTITDLIVPDNSINENVNPSYCGLFGYIDTQGIVKNLHIRNASNPSNATCVRMGVLAATNKGHILNCTVKGSKELHYNKTQSFGFLCGNMDNGWIVNCCTANNKIQSTAVSRIGGISGDATGHILNSYAFNNEFSVSESTYLGGLVGMVQKNSLTIENCYLFHPNEINKRFAAAVSEASNVTTNYFVTNIGPAYKNKNNETTISNSKIYDEKTFLIEKTTPIADYLNKWITEKGNVLYPNLTFKEWLINQDSGYAYF